MKKSICLLCLSLAIILSACVTPLKVQKELNKRKYQLGYVFDSKIAKNESNRKVNLVVHDKLDLSDTTLVEKTKGSGWFIVFAGGYNYDFIVKLGKKSVSPPIDDFFYTSFCTESKRSGAFMVSDSNEKSDLLIEITLEKCIIKSDYHTNLFVGPGLYFSKSYARPKFNEFMVNARLLSKDSLIFSQKYVSWKSAIFADSKAKDIRQLKRFMMENLAESTSLMVKELVEYIVKDVKEYLFDRKTEVDNR